MTTETTRHAVPLDTKQCTPRQVCYVDPDKGIMLCPTHAAAQEMAEMIRQLAMLWAREPSPRDPSRGLADEARALLRRIEVE